MLTWSIWRGCRLLTRTVTQQLNTPLDAAYKIPSNQNLEFLTMWKCEKDVGVSIVPSLQINATIMRMEVSM